MPVGVGAVFVQKIYAVFDGIEQLPVDLQIAAAGTHIFYDADAVVYV